MERNNSYDLIRKCDAVRRVQEYLSMTGLFPDERLGEIAEVVNYIPAVVKVDDE